MQRKRNLPDENERDLKWLADNRPDQSLCHSEFQTRLLAFSQPQFIQIY